MNIQVSQLSQQTGVKFGTSGVRGRVVDMTDKVCMAYVSAFLQYLTNENLVKPSSKVGIAGDLRQSTPRIMNAVAAACIEQGFEPVNYGFIPSPAIALFGIENEIPTIMVTGSHIPDDRNGIKLNTAQGEILKQDELGILRQTVTINDTVLNNDGYLLKTNYLPEEVLAAKEFYIKRYNNFFEPNILSNKRIGLYAHSSVAAECLETVLIDLGAEVTVLAPSEQFIPVDTEAIRPQDVELAQQWASQHGFDAIVSTDGDGDRPLVSDEFGNWLRGDVAGVLCAMHLQAKNVITPVSSNSLVEKANAFTQVVRTKIGSPFVIEAMQQLAADNQQAIVGYEANGGFLQQSRLSLDAKQLAPLPTRDAVIVILAIIALAEQQQTTISQLLKQLPQRFTYSDRLKEFPTELSQEKIGAFNTGDLQNDLARFNSDFPELAKPSALDMTDGVRVTLENADVVHLRPSGNAPELRCYTEAESVESAQSLNQYCINIMQGWR